MGFHKSGKQLVDQASSVTNKPDWSEEIRVTHCCLLLNLALPAKFCLAALADEMAEAVTKQMGKPLKYARGEVNTMLSRAEHMASIAPEVLASDVLPAGVEVPIIS